MPTLEISAVQKTYPGEVHALREISLSIQPGLFGLLGPNGAGKSTLMRTLATLQEADSGTVRFGDIDVLEQPERVRAVLGYLPQEFGVYPGASADELLDYLAILKGISRSDERKAEIERLLVKTNLWDVRKRPMGTFSGGMRQRFGIAQALLGAPRLVIVDEPTAGLDPEERNRFHTLLAEIGHDVVVLLSTHIVHDVEELCGQMAVIDKGRALVTGDPLVLTEALRGKVYRRFVAPADVAAQPGLTVLSSRLQAGRPVLHALLEQPLDGWEVIDPNLEDVYFAALKSAR
ncbi:MAG: ABC transporter ATP-binding protein [Polyangia bacterium]